MARVHLFTPSSSNERHRHAPENTIAEEAPVPSLIKEEHENKTISVSSQPIEEQQPNLDVDTSSPSLSHAAFMTAPSSPEQQQQNDDNNLLTTSSAALTAALLQNAHGTNDMIGAAVAAALSSKQGKPNNNLKKKILN
jgi:hypothetical protein